MVKGLIYVKVIVCNIAGCPKKYATFYIHKKVVKNTVFKLLHA